jgi:hypothetical protein
MRGGVTGHSGQAVVLQFLLLVLLEAVECSADVISTSSIILVCASDFCNIFVYRPPASHIIEVVTPALKNLPESVLSVAGKQHRGGY